MQQHLLDGEVVVEPALTQEGLPDNKLGQRGAALWREFGDKPLGSLRFRSLVSYADLHEVTERAQAFA